MKSVQIIRHCRPLRPCAASQMGAGSPSVVRWTEEIGGWWEIYSVRKVMRSLLGSLLRSEEMSVLAMGVVRTANGVGPDLTEVASVLATPGIPETELSAIEPVLQPVRFKITHLRVKIQIAQRISCSNSRTPT